MIMKLIPLALITAVMACAQNGPQTLGSSASPPVPPAISDCAADGTVVNSITGEPIVRAHVNVTIGATTSSATTDSSGKWALSKLGCAPGQLMVTRPGFLQTAQNGNILTMTGGAIRPLTLVSGSPLHDLKTELVPQSVALGRVLDDQGDPVMNAQLRVLISRVVEGLPRFQQIATGATNDLGEYRIASLPHGKYILCVHSAQPNLQTQTITADSCYPGPLEGGAASAMDLPAGRETKVDFTLTQVVPVHIRGTVSGLPEGRGTGVNLIQRGIHADFGGNMPGSVRDGKFDFRVPPGSYMLTADYFEAGKRLTARVPVDATGSSDIDNIAVQLDAGFTVTGVVHAVSQSGQNAAASRQFPISLRPSEPVNGTAQLKWSPDHASFTFNDMVPGTYRLTVNPPSPYYVKSATLAGQDLLNTEVPISQAAGPIEITLSDNGGSIEGDVVDANGQPVAAEIILLRDTTRAANLRTQPNGHFKLQNVAPGDYTIYAWDDANEVEYANPDWMRHYGSGGVPVTVTAGQSNAQIKLTEQLVPAQ